jgi:hypothetical protein
MNISPGGLASASDVLSKHSAMNISVTDKLKAAL